MARRTTKTSRRHFLSSLFVLLISIWILIFVRNARRRQEEEKAAQYAALVSAISRATHDYDHDEYANYARFVVVTAATYSYRHFTANMLCSLRKTGAPYVLISLDAQMNSWALERNFTSVHININIPTSSGTETSLSASVSNFGSERFNQVTRDKVSAVVAVLSTGTDVIYVDSDVYFCSPTAIHNVISLSLGETGVDMVSQRSHVLHQPMNTGVYYMRSSPQAIKFLREDIAQNEEVHLDEQVLFNRILCRKGTVHRDIASYPMGCTSNGNVSARFLDAPAFPIGCTRIRIKDVNKHIIDQPPLDVHQLCSMGGIQLLHYSCVEGDRKVEEMKRRGMWTIDELGRCPSSKQF